MTKVKSLRGLVRRWKASGNDRHDRAFRRELTAPQLFVGSFAALIIAGTVGFKVLPGLYTDDPLSWLDALFTATSAVCVTGLIVVDTATYFTTSGQAYILLLIQLGGLGIITFTSLIIMTFGLRLSLRQESITRSSADIAPRVDHRHLTRHIVVFTLAMEAVGMLLRDPLPRYRHITSTECGARHRQRARLAGLQAS